jgi:hypothetical protein
MKIHVGQRIQARAKELKIGTTELGKMINTSKQNVYGIFKRESIDIQQLQDISIALKFNFINLFLTPELLEHSNQESDIQTLKKQLEEVKNELEGTKKELKFATEKLELLQKLNSFLELDPNVKVLKGKGRLGKS